MAPENFSLHFSREQIAARVKQLGEEISVWTEQVWQDSHSDVIAVPILRGGIFIFADLVREIRHSVEIAPAQAWAYQNIKNSALPKVKVAIEAVPAKGRSVLLIDEICDSGRTLESLTKALLEAGAREVKSAVLIRRILEGDSFRPDWVGFDFHGNQWLVGYGMEDCNKWRNLPDIYVIKQG